MAIIQRYVNTASTAGGDGTTNATVGANRAYASLAEWVANATGAGSDTYIVDCCGTAADTAYVNVSFGNHLTTGHVLIQGNRSDPAGFYTGNLAISTSNYRLDVDNTANGSCLILSEWGIIDGIQIIRRGATVGDFGVLLVGGPSNFSTGNQTIRKCRVINGGTLNQDDGINTNSQVGGQRYVENCLVTGFQTQIRCHSASENSSSHFYENTCYGGANSFVIEGEGSAGPVAVAKGNACWTSGGTNIATVSYTNFTSFDNATSDTSGEIIHIVNTSVWTSPGTGLSADFSILSSGALYQAVNPTLVTDDIKDLSRPGTTHDVGAFTFVAPGSVASSDGVAAVDGIGTAIAAADGSSAGVATVSGVGSSTAASIGATAGVGTAVGTGESTAESVASSAGTATVVGLSPVAPVEAVASSTGRATASGVGSSTAIKTGAFSSIGLGTALGINPLVTIEAVASSSGTALVSGRGPFQPLAGRIAKFPKPIIPRIR